MTWEGLTPPYATLVADPPWPYRDANSGSRTLQQRDASWQSVNQLGYSPMSMDGLRVLPVKELSTVNAHLYLWTTNAFMVEAHGLARAWGFEPKTILTWVKIVPGEPARVSMKTGYYFRGATEHVVFAVRGSLPLQTSEGLPTAFLWPRIGHHSVKPGAFFDLVQKASPGPYVELFSRQPQFGWDSWGWGYEGITA